MTRLRYRPGLGVGCYLVDDGARDLGEVRKITKSYNIAPRPITTVEWFAYPPGGGERTTHRTRAQAGEYLQTLAGVGK